MGAGLKVSAWVRAKAQAVRCDTPAAVLADLHIRSETSAVVADFGQVASSVTFRHNRRHHSQQRIRSCG
jgi:hypothetical protein